MDLPTIGTCDDIMQWLRNKNFDGHTCNVFSEHSIDQLAFSLLTESDFREMGITSIGIRKRLLCLSQVLHRHLQASSVLHRELTWGLPTRSSETVVPLDGHPSAAGRNSSTVGTGFYDNCIHPLKQVNWPLANGVAHRPGIRSRSPDVGEVNPKIWKVILSALYAFLSLGATSFVMVIAHERLPDISKYSPLPDLLLDNLPYISWGFEATEFVIIILSCIWTAILIFHNHRFVLLRRFCSLLGTVFLLRCVTMLLTSLSVPGHHLMKECKPFVFQNFEERVYRAFNIWLGLGMTLRGIRTCGDYMFSGHTAILTMLNFFITEYTPAYYHLLHTLTWILNVFGVFFILAAHEHYSIDVFIAVYITSRLFLYYHWLANNRIWLEEDDHRAMVWFPLFYFFEYDVRGTVPNDFSVPLLGCVKRLAERFSAISSKAIAATTWTPSQLKAPVIHPQTRRRQRGAKPSSECQHHKHS